MKLVKCDINKVGGMLYKKSCNLKILEEFVESGMECAKVEGWNHSNASVCVTSLNLSIKRYKIGGIHAITRKGEVYLVKQ